MAETTAEELKKALLYVLDDLRENKYMHGATCTARRLEPCDCGLYELEQYINDVLGGNVLDKSLREPGGIVFTETTQTHEVRAVIDSEGNARLYPDRKGDNDET